MIELKEGDKCIIEIGVHQFPCEVDVPNCGTDTFTDTIGMFTSVSWIIELNGVKIKK